MRVQRRRYQISQSCECGKHAHFYAARCSTRIWHWFTEALINTSRLRLIFYEPLHIVHEKMHQTRRLCKILLGRTPIRQVDLHHSCSFRCTWYVFIFSLYGCVGTGASWFHYVLSTRAARKAPSLSAPRLSCVISGTPSRAPSVLTWQPPTPLPHSIPAGDCVSLQKQPKTASHLRTSEGVE